ALQESFGKDDVLALDSGQLVKLDLERVHLILIYREDVAAINVSLPQRQAQVAEESLCFFLFAGHHLHRDLMEWPKVTAGVHEDRQALAVLPCKKETALHAGKDAVAVESNVDVFDGAFRGGSPAHERRAP